MIVLLIHEERAVFLERAAREHDRLNVPKSVKIADNSLRSIPTHLQAFSLFGCNSFLTPDKLCVELGLLVHKLFCHEFVSGDHKNNTTRERADEEARYHAKCRSHYPRFYSALSNVATHVATAL
jgi:hypothetical protein